MMEKSLLLLAISATLIVAAAIIIILFLQGEGPVSRYTQSFCVNAQLNPNAVRIALESGIKCFRDDVYLNNAAFSAFVSNVSEAGGGITGILDYDTLGVEIRNGTCVKACNWTLGLWNNTVTKAVEEYPSIKTWEIWNEPLVPIFMSGYENGSAHNYFEMIKSAYYIIKSRQPNSTIICFGGAQIFPPSVQELSFYSDVWSYGAAKYCDAISVHAYTLPFYSLSQQTGAGTVAQLFNYSLGEYESLTSKPIYVTETGMPSNNWTSGQNFSQNGQAEFLIEDTKLFASHNYVKAIYWFNLYGKTGYGANFGLLNPNLTPNKAFLEYYYLSTRGVPP